MEVHEDVKNSQQVCQIGGTQGQTRANVENNLERLMVAISQVETSPREGVSIRHLAPAGSLRR
jgi:hypothetical protein